MKDRKAYIDKLTAQLKEWDAEAQKLEAKFESVRADLKIEVRRRLDEVRERKEAALKQLETLRKSGEDAWEEFAGGLEKSWDELKKAVERAREALRG